MAVKIGGLGSLGVGFETAIATYVTPDKFFPFRSEGIDQPEEKIWRMNIRGVADRQDPIQGFYRVEGPVTFEVTPDVLVYFLYAARVNITKDADTPAVGLNTYTFRPAHVTEPTTGAGPAARKTLSLLIERADDVRAYVGCTIGALEFSFDAGLLVCQATVFGRDVLPEAPEVPVYDATLPFSPQESTVHIGVNPAPARTDVDTATLTINDAPQALNRLGGNRNPDRVVWGGREVSFTAEHDFADSVDFDAFLDEDRQEVIVESIKGTVGTVDERSVKLTLNTTVSDSYTVNLGGMGDIVRASIAQHAYFNQFAVGDAQLPYVLEVVTDVDIT